jgi:hypothetical protein
MISQSILRLYYTRSIPQEEIILAFGEQRSWKSRAAVKAFGYVHACAAYPLSDCIIKIPIE